MTEAQAARGRTVPGSARLGIGVLVVAALAALWELLARQSPGSLLYLGMLPGPVEALRETALNLGLLLVAAGWLGTFAFPGAEPRALSWVLGVGAGLGLGASVYGALQGMLGVQLDDPRPDATPVFVARTLGLALVAGGLLEVGRRALSRPPGDGGGGPAT